MVAAGPELDLASNDPLVGYLLSAASAVDITSLQLQSPALKALQEAGVVLVVPLISSGSLVGLLSLGPRRSERGYSTDDLRLLNSLAGYAAPAMRVGQLVRQQQAEARQRERIEQELKIAQIIQQQFLPEEPARPAQLARGRVLPPGPDRRRRLLRLHPPAGRPGHVRGRRRHRQGHPGRAGHGEHARAAAGRGTPAHLARQGSRPRQRHALRRTSRRTCSSPAWPWCSTRSAARSSSPTPATTCRTCATRNGVRELRARGMPLGLMQGMDYEEKSFQFEPGDCALLHSDGLAEAHAPDREMFGFPRVSELVGKGPSGEALIDLCLTELGSFTGPEHEQEDDITLVSLQRSPSAWHQGRTQGTRGIRGIRE